MHPHVFGSLMIALSPFTVLPVYVNMIHGMDLQASRKMALKAIVTALILSVSVVLAGPSLFGVLGMTLNDLRIGGGLVLLMIAVYDVVFSRERRKRSELSDEMGVVPLGTPLIVGPGTITTSLVLTETTGRFEVIMALVANLFLIWLLLHFGHVIRNLISPPIARAFGKVMSLMLAAMAVAILRQGLSGL